MWPNLAQVTLTANLTIYNNTRNARWCMNVAAAKIWLVTKGGLSRNSWNKGVSPLQQPSVLLFQSSDCEPALQSTCGASFLVTSFKESKRAAGYFLVCWQWFISHALSRWGPEFNWAGPIKLLHNFGLVKQALHITMDQKSKELIVFVLSAGVHHFQKMPFALNTASSTFRRFVSI